MLNEYLGTAFHSVDSCELKPGEWFAIVGCGGLGQAACQYAKAMGLRVVGVDVDDAALAEIKALGADLVFNSVKTKDYADQIKAATSTGGVHAAAVYSASTRAYESALTLLRLNGLLMVVGLPTNPFPVLLVDLCIGKYRIKGESTSIPQRMGKAVDFIAKHNL
jgi:propanol-preferring alcohol dehydrogenase